MSRKKVYRAIGLMSGTSLDGIDAALIETDGYAYVKPLDFITMPYEEGLRAQIRACFGRTDTDAADIRQAEHDLTLAHVQAIKALGERADLIGFHGQTIFHAPAEGITVQLGDGDLLAQETGMDVVCDFRTADVLAGGEGAPLLPLYHRALVQSAALTLPVVILNIGGVANVTWVCGEVDHEILAFDTGPGNALMDDWAQKHTGARFDEGGHLAAAGHADQRLLAAWLAHTYFQQRPPKSLDRNEWDIAALGPLADQAGGLSAEDGAATLLEFTARTIAGSVQHMPSAPSHWYVCGGGRHNITLMRRLAALLDAPVADVSTLGWNGDAIEAEGFGYLAVRSVLEEPLSLPSTTGVSSPQSGGKFCRA